MRSYDLRLGLVLGFLASAALLAQPSGGLPTPTGLEASDRAFSTKVGLSWDHVRHAKLYRVFRSTTNDVTTAMPIGSTPSVVFYDNQAAVEQRYFYWLRAEDGGLQSDFSAPAEGVRADGETFAFGRIGPLQPPRPPAHDNPVTGAKVYLGKTLFWDEQLSSTRTVSCGTCHFFRHGGGDERAVPGMARSAHPGFDGTFGGDDDVVGSPGVPLNHADGSYELSPLYGLGPQVTRRKALSMVDSAYADQGVFWDGRAGRTFDDPLTGEPAFGQPRPLDRQALENQAVGPILDEVEMGSPDRDWADVILRLSESQPLALAPTIPAPLAAWLHGRTYPELFLEAFGSPQINPVAIASAIASYERTLVSDRTPHDRYVSKIGEEPPEVARGREVFLDSDCAQCHRGPLISDNRFHFIGVRPDTEDLGRAEVQGSRFRGEHRTPSLRNVALRAPYMHNGGFATLEEVIDFYNDGGDFDGVNKATNFVRNLRLSDDEKADLLAFLRSLTDPRVEAELGPLFDRPMLYAESLRVPEVLGTVPRGLPQVMAIEPPLVGNPSFTVGVHRTRAGGRATLVIGREDPGPGPAIPPGGSLAFEMITLKGEGREGGYGSVNVAIPNDPSLIGQTFFGRWYVRSGLLIETVEVSPPFRFTIFGPTNPVREISSFTGVSAASLATGLVAPESIVSGFGPNVATSLQSATAIPLPTTLDGVSVIVRDSAGVARLASLLFVSQNQINYIVPAGTALGEAVASALQGGAIVASGALQVAPAAPTLFSANADGRGPAAALLLRISPDGSQTFENVARFDASLGVFVTASLEPGEQAFLLLFGTGIRGAAAELTATIGGRNVEIQFAGEQSEFPGLDQVNLILDASFANTGEQDVAVANGDRVSNLVRVRFGN